MAQGFDEEIPEKKSSKKKLVIILLIVLIILGGGAAGGWYFYSQQHAGPHKEEAAKPEPPKPPVFLSLETFTVNLQPDPDDGQYLQVEVTLKVGDGETAELMKLHMPEVRNRVLLLLSSKKASEVTSLEGKKKLTEEIITQLKEPFSPGAKPQEISGVFFTSFVVQ